MIRPLTQNRLLSEKELVTGQGVPSLIETSKRTISDNPCLFAKVGSDHFGTCFGPLEQLNRRHAVSLDRNAYVKPPTERYPVSTECCMTKRS